MGGRSAVSSQHGPQVALKLGNASGAMHVYLDLLASGVMPASDQLVQRKLLEATDMLSTLEREDSRSTRLNVETAFCFSHDPSGSLSKLHSIDQFGGISQHLLSENHRRDQLWDASQTVHVAWLGPTACVAPTSHIGRPSMLRPQLPRRGTQSQFRCARRMYLRA